MFGSVCMLTYPFRASFISLLLCYSFPSLRLNISCATCFPEPPGWVLPVPRGQMGPPRDRAALSGVSGAGSCLFPIPECSFGVTRN